MSGAGRFFLKLLDDGIRILPFVSACDFLSFCGIVNKPDCFDGLSQVLFDRDGVSVLKTFPPCVAQLLSFHVVAFDWRELALSLFLAGCPAVFRESHFSVSRSVSTCVLLLVSCTRVLHRLLRCFSVVHGFSCAAPYFSGFLLDFHLRTALLFQRQ